MTISTNFITLQKIRIHMKKEQDLKDRLKIIRELAGLTQEGAAELIGRKQQSWCALEAGEAYPSRETINRIVKKFHISESWLLFGEEKMLSLNEEKINLRYIPLVKWRDIILNVNLHLIKTEDILPMAGIGSEKTIALKVYGDSMTSPIPGKDSFTENDYIFIDPEQNVVNGNFVIAILENSEEPIFKQYIIEGNKKYLRSLNPQYPLIEITNKIKIFGVVIGKFTKF